MKKIWEIGKIGKKKIGKFLKNFPNFFCLIKCPELDFCLVKTPNKSKFSTEVVELNADCKDQPQANSSSISSGFLPDKDDLALGMEVEIVDDSDISSEQQLYSP